MSTMADSTSAGGPAAASGIGSTGDCGPAAVPAGTIVTVLSHADGQPVAATVQTWSAGDEGLVISARLTVGAAAVARLADHRVWVSLTHDAPGFTVFGGIAHAAGDDSLDVTGVAPLVREARRTAPRAAATTRVMVTTPSLRTHDLRAVDLGRGGVRVSLQEPAELTAGERVTVEVHLEDGATVLAGGQVARVDEAAGQAVVRFDELANAEGSRLDRFALLRLTAPR